MVEKKPMVHTIDPSAPAAAAAPTSRVHVPGGIVAAPPQAAEHLGAAEADLGEMISRERRRHAETRPASEPLADAAGARVCCVLCFNRNAEPAVEDAR
jgi:hypothetical protein